MSVYEKMTAIADAIREKTGKTEKLDLDDIASGVDEVYDAGVKSEYDKFWDKFQNYGQRTAYDRAGGRNFASECWSFANFYPKYDIKPVGDASQLFYNWNVNFGNDYIGDFAQRLEDCDVILDISNATNAALMFGYDSGLTRLPLLDFSNCSSCSEALFSCSALETIEKIIFSEKNTNYNNLFNRCNTLKNVVFDGVIALNLDVHWSPLTRASLMSLFGVLKDFSASGTTRTLTLGSSNLAKLTESEKTIATGKGWTLA